MKVPRAEMANQTIIVTNDDPQYLELIQDILCEEGYTHVCCVLNGQADEAIRRERPALVLLDIHPACPAGGWQLLDRLRHDPATARVPVIICTTLPRLVLAVPELARTCDILEKPFQLEQLLHNVQARIGPPAPRGEMS